MAFTEKYVTVTGGGLHDGSSEANAWTLAEAASNMSAGDRINVKAGTYTLSSAIIINAASTVSSPVSMRGYKTTIGDLDAKPTSQLIDGTDRPLIRIINNSFYFQVSSPYLLMENISCESTVSYPSCFVDAKGVYSRCKFKSSGGTTPTNGYPIIRATNIDYLSFNNCHFDGNNMTGRQQTFQSDVCVGCLFENFSTGSFISGSRFTPFLNCIFRNMDSGIIYAGTHYGFSPITGCTFYNIAQNAIYENGASTAPTLSPSIITNNVFHTIGGDAIKSNASVSGKFDFFADNNLFYNVAGSNYTNNIGLNRNAISEASDPFVDAAGGDYSLVSSSGGYGKAQPNPFEGLAADSRRDIGAIQHADPSGGGGAVLHPLRSN